MNAQTEPTAPDKITPEERADLDELLEQGAAVGSEPTDESAAAHAAEERLGANDALPVAQVTFPLVTFQVLRGGSGQGRVLVAHTPLASLVFPIPQQQVADAIARDLSSKVEIVPAGALGSLKGRLPR